MKQVMNYNKDNGLLNMIRRTDPMINKANGDPGEVCLTQNGLILLGTHTILPPTSLLH